MWPCVYCRSSPPLAIREQLVEADSTNAGWQRALIVSYAKLYIVTEERTYAETSRQIGEIPQVVVLTRRYWHRLWYVKMRKPPTIVRNSQRNSQQPPRVVAIVPGGGSSTRAVLAPSCPLSRTS